MCTLVWMRGDGERGQTKGLISKEGRRGGAQMEAGSGKELKGAVLHEYAIGRFSTRIIL